MIDDGVVKYSLNFVEKEINISNEYNKIEGVRKRLISLGLIGAYDNGIGYGNISMRYKNPQEFVITATQTGHLKDLEEREYSLVDHIDYQTFTTKARGESKPSSECITHGAIYELDPRINAVIHIHNEKLWNFMLENGYLATNDTPYGTPEMVEDVREIYKKIEPLKNSAFVMKGHFEGVVTFGESLEEAERSLFDILRELLRS